jgi:hypothetical protein
VHVQQTEIQKLIALTKRVVIKKKRSVSIGTYATLCPPNNTTRLNFSRDFSQASHCMSVRFLMWFFFIKKKTDVNMKMFGGQGKKSTRNRRKKHSKRKGKGKREGKKQNIRDIIISQSLLVNFAR